MVTTEQVKAATDLVIELGRAILAAGDDGIPSGHLYAMVMSAGISLATYQGAIGLLKRSGLVSESGHVLKIQIKS